MARRSAAAELRAASARLAHVRLSAAATGLLLDLVARCLAGASPGFAEASGTDDDLGVQIVLTRSPGSCAVVRGADGDFALDGLRLAVGTASAAEHDTTIPAAAVHTAEQLRDRALQDNTGYQIRKID